MNKRQKEQFKLLIKQLDRHNEVISTCSKLALAGNESASKSLNQLFELKREVENNIIELIRDLVL